MSVSWALCFERSGSSISESRPIGARRISKPLITVDEWPVEPVIFWSVVSFPIETLPRIPTTFVNSRESRCWFVIKQIPTLAGTLNVVEDSDVCIAAERCKPASATAGYRTIWSLTNLLRSDCLSCFIIPRQLPQTSWAIFSWSLNCISVHNIVCIISQYDLDVTVWSQFFALVCMWIAPLDTVQMLKISENSSHSISIRSDPSVPRISGIDITISWTAMHRGNAEDPHTCLMDPSSSIYPAAGKIGNPATRWSQKYVYSTLSRLW